MSGDFINGLCNAKLATGCLLELCQCIGSSIFLLEGEKNLRPPRPDRVGGEPITAVERFANATTPVS